LVDISGVQIKHYQKELLENKKKIFGEICLFFIMSDPIGWKKLHDCRESILDAFLNMRTPLKFEECVAPILLANDIKSNTFDDELNASKIELGQIISFDKKKLSYGFSPIANKCYFSYHSYAQDHNGIFFYEQLKSAWNSYRHLNRRKRNCPPYDV
jgi:hypothetical protein